jgi:hypothetical protein
VESFHWVAMPPYGAGSKPVSVEVTHWMAIPHNRAGSKLVQVARLPTGRLCPNMGLAVSQDAIGDVSHWMVMPRYKAGGKPVSEWRGYPLGGYAPIRG